MNIFKSLEDGGYEELIFCQLGPAKLKAIVAIHDTTLGPALGGCRIWRYSSEDEAIEDALRLSKGMTYKAAVAGLNLGGGKAVIIADPKRDKSELLLRAFGRFVETFGGRYITAEDVGTSVEDMEVIQQETSYVTGISTTRGGSGDPSLVTAYGVFMGMKACIREVYSTESLKGMIVTVQGVGHVGYHLVANLVKEGAKIVATDVNEVALQKVADDFGVQIVHPDDIYQTPCNIFSPNAMGGVLNDRTIPLLRCTIVAGAANNQLLEARHGDDLTKRRILYAPDYVINAGGLINVADEMEGYNRERALRKAATIFDSVSEVINIGKRDNIPTYQAAQRMAEERIARIKELKRIYI